MRRRPWWSSDLLQAVTTETYSPSHASLTPAQRLSSGREGNREMVPPAHLAEVPALAGEGKQVFVGTGVTPDAREPVLEDAAGEELVRDLADDGAPRAVVAREALVVHRLQVMEMILHQ